MNTYSEEMIPTFGSEDENQKDVISRNEGLESGKIKTPESFHELIKMLADMRNAAPADDEKIAFEDEQDMAFDDDAQKKACGTDEELPDDEDAEDGSPEGEESLRDLFKMMAHMRGADSTDEYDIAFDEDEKEEESGAGMDAEAYHNKACVYSLAGKHKKAIEVCQKGLKHFPTNVDLLASIIAYCSDSGDQKSAAKYYATLKDSIPFPRWGWRAYMYAIRYLMSEDPAKNEAECRMLVSNYRKYIPYEEKSYLAESELEEALGNRERSMQVLEEAIATRNNASMCALRLVGMQMDRGMFEEALQTANYGIAASAEAQPSINMPHLCYLRALAKDHLIHRKEFVREPVSREEVVAVEKEYRLLLKEFSTKMMRHATNIKERISMLAFVQTTD